MKQAVKSTMVFVVLRFCGLSGLNGFNGSLCGRSLCAEEQPDNFLKNYLSFWMNADNKFRQSFQGFLCKESSC